MAPIKPTAPPQTDGPHARIGRAFLPATAFLELTYRCDRRCVTCTCPWEADDSDYERRPEMNLPQWKEVVFRLTKLGIHDFAFAGGEPLLMEGFEDLVNYAAGLTAEFVETDGAGLLVRRAPPRLFLYTCGASLRPDLLTVLGRLRVQVVLSLPGLATYRDHTGEGDAEAVLATLRAARARGVSTTVAVTVTRKNLPELYEIMAEALLAGADAILLERFFAAGRGLAHAAELSLGPDDVVRMLDTAEEVCALAGRRGVVGTSFPPCVTGRARPHLDMATRCRAGADFFVVDPAGFVRVCPHATARLGNVRALVAVREHPLWRRFTQRQYMPGRCADCASFLACDGGCREAAHLANDRLDSLDPLMR
jgi:radical SAM protein with 4Fe4S-binding SPASM domain